MYRKHIVIQNLMPLPPNSHHHHRQTNEESCQRCGSMMDTLTLRLCRCGSIRCDDAGPVEDDYSSALSVVSGDGDGGVSFRDSCSRAHSGDAERRILLLGQLARKSGVERRAEVLLFFLIVTEWNTALFGNRASGSSLTEIDSTAIEVNEGIS